MSGTKRYAFAALEARIMGSRIRHVNGCDRCWGLERGTRTGPDAGCMTDESLGAVLGVARRTVPRWRAEGRMFTRDEAERLADRAGVHPSEVWPELVDDNIAALTRSCARDECDVMFVPTRKSHRFCSRRCYDRSPERRAASAAAERERWANDEAYRAQRSATKRVYYVETHRAELLRQRRYGAANRAVINAKRRARYAAARKVAA